MFKNLKNINIAGDIWLSVKESVSEVYRSNCILRSHVQKSKIPKRSPQTSHKAPKYLSYEALHGQIEANDPQMLIVLKVFMGNIFWQDFRYS